MLQAAAYLEKSAVSSRLLLSAALHQQRSRFSPPWAAWRGCASSTPVVSPSSFDSVCREVEGQAAPGVVWPERSRAILTSVNKLIGGRWLLVECGHFLDGHPLAGKPARAVLHVAICYTVQSDQGGVEAAVKGNGKQKKAAARSHHDIQFLTDPTSFKELPLHSFPMAYYAAYALGADGFPTGRLLTVTEFEQSTTNTHHRKVESSCRVFWHGKPQETLNVWHTAKLLPFNIRKPPRPYAYHTAGRYLELAQAAGADVRIRTDAASMSKADKQRREAAQRAGDPKA